MGAVAVGWRWKRWALGLAGVALVIPLGLLAVIAMIAAMLGGIAGEMGSDGTFSPSAGALNDIPAEYLAIYQATGKRYGLDWAYLAAIGKIETDHGAANRPGWTNSYGCCAGPMQMCVINGCPGGGARRVSLSGAQAGTWRGVRVDGNGDGRYDPWDPEDAIPAAAKMMKANGAPGDWQRALHSYNPGAPWYPGRVTAIADGYRGAALAQGGPLSGVGVPQKLSGDGKWLMRVPGTNATCDRRIVPDVVWLLERYRMSAGDCYAPTGHDPDGEHPLGLGLDLTPGRGGSWALLDKAARDLGWRPTCSRNGCLGNLPQPMRFIGWNNYPGHGDPAHVGGNAHLHLSWNHSGGKPAHTVQTLLKGKP